ncbi:metal ABC transporter permease, partial [Paenibacillus sp. OT2-17]|uniref:metal ABC transporter permease n=1 Tax=Paenibacillus sp. OT2-17 TaxID=2691605 RepID=UPI001355A023
PSFAAAIWISMITALIGVFMGLTASYELSRPPGGTIAMVLLLFLIVGAGIQKLVRKLGKQQASRRKNATGQ